MGRVWVWREEEAGVLLKEVRTLVDAGDIVALPTETFYALAVNAFQEKALARLFALKERPPEKPVLVLIAGPEILLRVAREVPESARRLMARFWPGPLTLILPARAELPRLITGDTDTVGVRQPRQAVTCRLLAGLGLPVTGTSANRAGRLPLTRAAAVQEEFGEAVSLIVDAGPCPGGPPSTIVDLAGSPPRLVRPGAIETASLLEYIPDLQVEVTSYGERTGSHRP
ncbi:MAG: L-threonylcarbamoyladenylate synthase [Thermodesulfobacteriota bacterium]